MKSSGVVSKAVNAPETQFSAQDRDDEFELKFPDEYLDDADCQPGKRLDFQTNPEIGNKLTRMPDHDSRTRSGQKSESPEVSETSEPGSPSFRKANSCKTFAVN